MKRFIGKVKTAAVSGALTALIKVDPIVKTKPALI
jgi:hypothetical protein